MICHCIERLHHSWEKILAPVSDRIHVVSRRNISVSHYLHNLFNLRICRLLIMSKNSSVDEYFEADFFRLKAKVFLIPNLPKNAQSICKLFSNHFVTLQKCKLFLNVKSCFTTLMVSLSINVLQLSFTNRRRSFTRNFNITSKIVIKFKLNAYLCRYDNWK